MKPEWFDWKWQLQNRIIGIDKLRHIIQLTEDERDALEGRNGLLPSVKGL